MREPKMTEEQLRKDHEIRRQARRLGFTVYLDFDRPLKRRYLRVKDYSGKDPIAWRSFVAFVRELFPEAREYKAQIAGWYEATVNAVSITLRS